jgi:hypothetical protein
MEEREKRLGGGSPIMALFKMEKPLLGAPVV